MSYIGERRENQIFDWLMFTIGTGVLPAILKLIIILLAGEPSLSVELFHTEFFFLSIVLLMDILRKTSKNWVRWKVALILLVIYSGIYGLILCSDLGLLNIVLQSETVFLCSIISIIAEIVIALSIMI